MNDSFKKIAIVPGSFDPITYGHLSLVKEALKDYDKVYVAVMINEKKEYCFTLSERKEIAEAAINGLERVEVISSEGMLWQLAKDLGAVAIVRGYRNENDLAYEQAMAQFNAEHYPNAKTILLPSEDELSDLSSTVVRQSLRNGSSLSQYLPENAIATIKRILSK